MREGSPTSGARCGSATCSVPGLTDAYDNVQKVADFVCSIEDRRARGDPALSTRWAATSGTSSAFRIRWRTPSADTELSERVRGQFRARGLTVY
jgi:pyruvate formate lyase activating enzyme